MKLSNALKQRLSSKYGPWALVSGATSGIGFEIASRLAEAGLHVALHGRNAQLLAAHATALSTQFGIQTRVITSDLSTQEGIAQLISGVLDLDIGLMVASAGYGTSGEWIKANLAAEINMLRVNCEALMVLTHHFSQRFAQRKRGGIILMGSLVGFQGTPYAAHYAATKAYVQSLAEALSVELKPLGVDVLAAAPGPVNSGFGDRADLQMGKAMTPEQVGIPILKALGRRQTVLPGMLTKLLVGALRTVPRWAKVHIMKLVMGGMTEHQRA
jgi:uncharacterized protein